MHRRISLIGLFLLVIGASLALASARAQGGPPQPVLRLHRGTFDAAAAQSPSVIFQFNRNASGPFSILQFGGPITEKDRTALLSTGVRILEYLPEYAYLVAGTETQLRAAEVLPGIYARTGFTLADKLAPGLLRLLQSNAVSYDPVAIYGWPQDGGRLRQELKSLPFDTRGRLTGAQLIRIAGLESARWIEPAGTPRIVNDLARDITNVTPIWQSQSLFGSGILIGITDSGLDTGDPGTISPDFAGRIAATYVVTSTANWADENGHGTHVAGSAAGSGVQSGANPAQHDYAASFAGTAPEAQLVIQAFEVDVNGAIIGLPADYADLYTQMYATGVRLHSNSWGDTTGPPGDPSEFGGYDEGAQSTDDFIWTNPTMAIFFAAGNSGRDGTPMPPFGFCTGGDGVVDPDSLLSPGTAKNVITVGASESDRSDGPLAGFPWLLVIPCFGVNPIATDLISNNPDGMAPFSSRGPVDDGRIKPDITAPGVNILSNRSHAPGAGTLWGEHDDHYAYSGGTSMATPHLAGLGALVREWLNLNGTPDPSAALLKAILLNTTADMAPGQYGTGPLQEIPDTRPNNVSGWGRADASFMDPTYPYELWFDDHLTGLSTGETAHYNGTALQPLEVITSTQPLRVMLVWTDPPASLAASVQLVNDLDLVVTGPLGQTYHGNDVPTGDRLNNVEGIVIDNPVVGDYEISIEGFNVPISSQPYALVVAGPLDDGQPPPPTPSPTPGNPTATPTATPVVPPSATPTAAATATPTLEPSSWLFLPVARRQAGP